jgi:hypothetical protein
LICEDEENIVSFIKYISYTDSSVFVECLFHLK